MSKHRLQRFAPFVYIALLLFAQQGAYLHAAWHAGEQAHAETREQAPLDSSFQDELCGLHGAFCQVLGALPGSVAHVPAAPSGVETLAHRVQSRIPFELNAPLSRGPPASV
jgi:hypothetical protein